MKIYRVDNTQFGALIKIKSPEELFAQANRIMENMNPEQRGLSAMASCSGMSTSGAGLMTGGFATQTAGVTSDVVGSAYMLKASGVDSFGIAPSAMEKSAPYLTPETMLSTNQNPETAGSIFSTIGAYIHKYFKIVDTKPKKVPS